MPCFEVAEVRRADVAGWCATWSSGCRRRPCRRVVALSRSPTGRHDAHRGRRDRDRRRRAACSSALARRRRADRRPPAVSSAALPAAERVHRRDGAGDRDHQQRGDHDGHLAAGGRRRLGRQRGRVERVEVERLVGEQRGVLGVVEPAQLAGQHVGRRAGRGSGSAGRRRAGRPGSGMPARTWCGAAMHAGGVAHPVRLVGDAGLGVRPVPGERAVQHRADRADVGLGGGGLVGPGVAEHHPAVVSDEHRARLHVAVRHAGVVQRGDRGGDGVGDRDGLVGLERPVARPRPCAATCPRPTRAPRTPGRPRRSRRRRR